MKKLLLRNIVEGHLELTAAQRKAVHERVMTCQVQERWGNLARLVPGFLPLVMIPVWTRLARSWNVPWQAAFQTAFAIAGMFYLYWIFRRSYARHACRAIRELGFANICAHCGYNLEHGEVSDRPICPECGTPISSMPAVGSLPPRSPRQSSKTTTSQGDLT
jgi:hypothetical protein